MQGSSPPQYNGGWAVVMFGGAVSWARSSPQWRPPRRRRSFKHVGRWHVRDFLFSRLHLPVVYFNKGYCSCSGGKSQFSLCDRKQAPITQTPNEPSFGNGVWSSATVAGRWGRSSLGCQRGLERPSRVLSEGYMPGHMIFVEIPWCCLPFCLHPNRESLIHKLL
jgi:hypothetical protein